MAEVRCNKKRLSINLSLFALTDQISSQKPTKSTKKFEDPNGVVGLGIVAAMNKNYQNHAILAISPRSSTNPIPIFSHRTANNCNQNGNCKKNKRPSIEEMEMCEEYTCVISHEGSNLVKKREYFDGEFIGNSETTAFGTSDFLNACFLCNKQLQGLDIFMYSRGEKAFCSAECRCKQISIDEHKEKFSSGGMKSLEYSASPCSGPMQFFAGVTVA